MNYSKALNLIEEHLEGLSFKGNPKELYEPIAYTIQMGGKRIRPALLLMAGALYHRKVQNLMNAAVGIELFHNFTLIHDDIMDNAPLRRGKKTVHNKWNNDIAILSGDVMFVRASQYMSQCRPQHLIPTLELFQDMAIQVCEGQQMDMNFENQEKVSITQYIQMIEKKTAILIATSLKIGGILGGANRKDADNLYEFGKHIGIAFQLQDDILDVYADGEQFGKRIGGDIISNKKTFLFLTAKEEANEEVNQKIEASLKISEPNKKVEQMIAIYDDLDIKSIAEKKMNRYFKRGMGFLKDVEIADDKKKDLKELAESLMLRNS